ncbi:hypothetical protein BKA83DRAFT_3481764 [Pisolithus microcarpus]|nr:hypothetical protein BKA83DRAFT_3481764 [Pisolithus microcarpus]
MIIDFIKRMLGVRRGGQPVQLFSGCGVYSQTLEHTSTLVILVTACFSKQVPSIIIERWELFVPGPPYRVTRVLADSETRLQVREARPDQTTDDSNTLIQLDTPSTPPPSVPGYKRKRESAYFDSPSGCYILSEFDKDGIPRRPRKLRKLRFEPSFTPKHDRLSNTPQLICHHHPSDDFNPFVTIANTSAKDQQTDDRTVANVDLEASYPSQLCGPNLDF